MGMTEKVGLRPKIPVKAAGIRTDPPPSVPVARMAIPEAMAAAEPADEPPVVCSVFHGLRVIPVRGESPTPFHPNSGVVVLPTKTAPPSRRLFTAGASNVEIFVGSVCREPLRVGHPVIAMVSLIAVGMPSMGLKCAPFRQRSSLAWASSRAVCASTPTNALRSGCN